MIKTKLILFLLLYCSTAWANVYIEIHMQTGVVTYNIASIDSISLIEPTPTYVIDAEAKKYPVGLIASHYWMLEDLTCAVYDTLSSNRGIQLKPSTDSTYTAYKVGRFYNWQAAVGITPKTTSLATYTTVQGICPNKFHLPTRKEWEKLFASNNYAGSSSFRHPNWKTSSNGLKRKGESPKDGFNSLASGYAKGTTIKDTELLSSYWSAESLSTNSALSCRLDATGSLSFSSANKELGKSVRCIWDGQTDRDWLYVYRRNVTDETERVVRYKIADIKQIVVKDNLSDGYIADKQNNIYKTKRYGSTMWMLEDLIYTKGLQETTLNEKFHEIAAYINATDCNTSYNGVRYYSKKVIQDYASSICPNSWRIPAQKDFIALVNADTQYTFIKQFHSAVYNNSQVFAANSEALYWVSDFTTGSYYENGEIKYYLQGIPYFEHFQGYYPRFSFVQIANEIPALPCRCIKDLTEPYMLCRLAKKSQTRQVGIWQTNDCPVIKFTQNSHAENVMYLENVSTTEYYDSISLFLE